jgi:hypothetical protein
MLDCGVSLPTRLAITKHASIRCLAGHLRTSGFSSLESLNFDEAVFLDNFYSTVITPIFFVECLADLEKQIKSNSTQTQLC